LIPTFANVAPQWGANVGIGPLFGAILVSVIPAPLITNLGNKAVIALPIKLTHFHGTAILLAMRPQWPH
jgi:hypothetical protein